MYVSPGSRPARKKREGGTNTNVIFNDGGFSNGSAGFTFNKTTNNVVIANSLTINGTLTVNTDVIGLGNSTINAVVNSSSIIVANSTVTSLFAIGVINVGANVFANTSTLSSPTGNFGNSVANVVANSTGVTVANSTNTVTIVPPSTVQKAGSFYLKADGTWASVSASVAAGGSDTQVQYNDATALNGSAGFTFGKTTNNVTIANTLTIGNFTANTTLVNAAALNVVNQINTVTFFASTTANVGANVQINTTAIFVGNSIANAVLGNGSVTIANTTNTVTIVPPSTAQAGSNTTFLQANGNWTSVTTVASPLFLASMLGGF